MRTDSVRFGVIGTGDFGPELTRYLNKVAEVVAICDPNPAARARFREVTGLQLPEFEHHEQLLDSIDVDAVAIVSPNHTHREIAVSAAQRGKHVFCEKTMALNVPECWEMIRACEKASVRLMVGHKRRLRPPWARMIELCDQLGPVVAITSVVYWDIRPYNVPSWWERTEYTGGLLPVADVHVTDWMRAMCGDVARVSAVAGPQVDPKYNYPDTLHMSLQFHSGAVASLNACINYPLLHFRQSSGPLVMCREGAMRFVPDMNHIDLYWQLLSEFQPQGDWQKLAATPHHERFDDLGFDHAYREETGDFVRWVTEGAEPCLTWREGLRCVEVMEAAERSAKQGGMWIDLPLYPDLEPA